MYLAVFAVGSHNICTGSPPDASSSAIYRTEQGAGLQRIPAGVVYEVTRQSS